MAAIDVYALAGHRTRIRRRHKNGFDEIIPECSCGYQGPAYPDSDIDIAETGLIAHRHGADPIAPFYITFKHYGTGRCNPVIRVSTEYLNRALTLAGVLDPEEEVRLKTGLHMKVRRG